MSYIYWYIIEPGCFKVGKGDQPERRMRSHSRKLLNGYSCDPASRREIAVPDEYVFAVETAIKNWLVAQGFPRVPLEIRATRTSEKERERRRGRKRKANEIFSRNGTPWDDIDAMLRQQIAAEIARCLA